MPAVKRSIVRPFGKMSPTYASVALRGLVRTGGLDWGFVQLYWQSSISRSTSVTQRALQSVQRQKKMCYSKNYNCTRISHDTICELFVFNAPQGHAASLHYGFHCIHC